MAETVPRHVLIKAVKLIYRWHSISGFTSTDRYFRIYYEQAPEMKDIRDVLGPYDEMKNEVISATSETGD